MSEISYSEQVPFGTDNFADNPEPRCPCLLLLDKSGSMSGEPINELNSGLLTFKEELLTDSLAVKRVEVAIITFGPVKIENDFHTAPNFFPPNLQADGDTPMGEAIKQGIEMITPPMGEAIKQGIEMITQRKEVYKTNGISYFRPWIFLITDGAPTDDWKRSAAMVREGESGKSFAFFAVGVQNAKMQILTQISVREPLKLQGLRFRELFNWLSASMKSDFGNSSTGFLLL